MMNNFHFCYMVSLFHRSLPCPLVAVLTLMSFLAPCPTGTQSWGTIFSFKNQGLHLAEFTGHTLSHSSIMNEELLQGPVFETARPLSYISLINTRS